MNPNKKYSRPRKRFSILGVPVDTLSRDEYSRKIDAFLAGHRPRHIITLNPEFILEAERNHEFARVLAQADLSIPDGFGLVCAGWVEGVHLARLPGSTLTRLLLSRAEARGLRIAVVCWSRGLSSAPDISRMLKQRYPRLACHVEAAERTARRSNLERLKRFRPDILFVAFGAPWQDLYIRRHVRLIPGLKVAVGVGGSFDFMTGAVKRAPRLFQRLGVEWIWRAFFQPGGSKMRLRRAKRIWRSVVVFPWKVIGWELRRFRYRPNVVAMIINPLNQVLIMNAAGSRNYWGLPQGGVDPGESLETALRREVREETGITDLELVAGFKNIYSYRLPNQNRWHGYKGQRQTLFVAKYYGANREVRLNPYEHKAYRWVPIEDLVRHSSPVRKKQYELFLTKYQKTI